MPCSPEHPFRPEDGTAMIPADILRPANEMIGIFGDDAQFRAALRADALMAQGKVDGSTLWKQIADAIGDLQRHRPAAGEELH
jgi:hypothetical protein